jgi:ankyrin repeat protein
LAAENGHEAVVRLLLATTGVDPDLRDSDGRTPLSRAAQKGHEAVVKLLLAQERVKKNSVDNYGMTPFFLATRKRHEAVIRVLGSILSSHLVMNNSYTIHGRVVRKFGVCQTSSKTVCEVSLLLLC